MKTLKHFIVCLVVMLLAMVNTMTAFATELAGDTVVDCNITINIIDLSGVYDGDAITVLFKDITGTAENTIELTKENSWGSGETLKLSIPAPTTYNITFSGVKNGYEVVDTTTNKSVESFAASEGTKEFYWSIVSISENESSVEEVEDLNSNTENNNVVTNSEEAEKAYKKFLDAVLFIEQDASWADGIAALLNQYGEESVNRNTYSQWYADYVQGGSKEEYFAMTPFEQFLWTETYTRLAYAVGGSNNFSQYFADEAAFKSQVTTIVVNLMNGNNNEVVKKAYEELMSWQYAYIKENGVPFNFINNRSYIEEIGKVPSKEETNVKTEEDEIKEAQKEALADEEMENPWSGTLRILADNAITILALIILSIAVAIVIYKRKEKNIDGIDGRQ